MVRVLWEADRVTIPGWVSDLESFRRWSDDAAFPETGHISFLAGEVWVDMSKEQLFSHNHVKMIVAYVLMGLALAEKKGRYFGDGVFVSNVTAEVSNQTDGVFVSSTSLREGRGRVIEGRSEGHVELEGSPDMVLEVVSASSVEKDTVVLRQAYAQAGILEYWLIDARKEPLKFDLLRLGRRAYTAARKHAGWSYSEVFSRWFRLTSQPGADGFPEFTRREQSDRPR